MNTLRKFFIVAGIITIFTSTSANASVVINFDSLNYPILESLSLGGLTFTKHYGGGMAVWGDTLRFTEYRDDPGVYTPEGFYSPRGTYLEITSTGGGLFDLISVDLKHTTGNIHEGFFVGATPYASIGPFLIDGGMNTYMLGLHGVSSVVMFGGFEGTWNLDNVVAVVPEPETYAMLLAGLGFIGFTMRRKNSTASMVTIQ